MGTYLSTPVVDKCEESGEALECPAAPLVWGVVDMQGWRKSMEDSHVAQTDVAVPEHLQTDQDHDAKVFGVFDGHGGAEVARFVQLYLVDVLTKQPTWQNEPETEDPMASPVGEALVDTFHALDRMIDQPERRDELIRLRAEKPQPGERKTADYIPPEKIHHSPVDVVKIGETIDENRSDDAEEEKGNSIEMNEIASSEEKRESSETDKESAEEPKDESPTVSPDEDKEEEDGAKEVTEAPNEGEHESEQPAAQKDEPEEKKTADASDDNKKEEKLDENATATTSGTEEASSAEPAATEAEAKESTGARESGTETSPSVGEEAEKPNTESDEAPALKEEQRTLENGESKAATEEGDGAEKGDGNAKDDDSNAAVGKEDAANLDQDLMLEDAESNKEETAEATNRKVTVMFQKLLSLGGNSGQMSLRIVDKETAEQSESQKSAASAAVASSQAIVPTVIQNGRQICNLPDHPIHAGCTAIVAVLIGRKLTVANAGDSRAVLCRAGGRTEALSFDHKPQQDRERSRINSAGGFVNQFGRVNGNLNLSRSIGDLKYKQVPGIHPAGQMITAEPDIVEVYLQSNDEFLILGCDGIWDCLTNIQAVRYVRERIDTMSPTEIGTQMLDEILSDDPRATQGIGGDNMTVMVIDFQPGKRSYRKASEPTVAA